MNSFISDQQAFKRAAQNLSKLPGTGSLSACQTILAKATGHRDLHHAQALQARPESYPTEASSAMQVEILSCLEKASGNKPCLLIDALQRARFFGPKTDPKNALNVRAELYSKEFPATSRRAIGSPCKIKEEGRPERRALLVSRGEERYDTCEAMTDHGIFTCGGLELIQHRTGQFFIPMRFWMPYGIWTEEDGSKVLFSRDYCPLWRIQEGRAPVQDDPNRVVGFIDQRWYFDETSFNQTADVARKRGLEILREYRVVSVPKLVEWLPECLKQKKWIFDFKQWPWGNTAQETMVV
ncbi:hypothetical protein A9Q95_12170 [Rhodobacterales bacterium 59_46_T64]|nr:hypothetical protein A9Q95_12170 [Rhodobacterales bacterium 59_46_T64]